MKNKLKAQGVPLKMIDRIFEEDLHSKWTRQDITNPEVGLGSDVSQKANDPIATGVNPPNTFGGGLQSGSGSGTAANDRIEAEDLILVETKDGLAAYSMSLGKWDRVIVGLPQDGRSRIQHSIAFKSFASAVINEHVFGFSSKAGRWGKLKIPPEFVGKVFPNHGVSMLSVKIGDQIYALSPSTGEWTSLDPATVTTSDSSPASPSNIETTDLRAAEQKPQLPLGNPESRRLADEISKHELRATELAEQIRTLNKAQQDGQTIDPKSMETRNNELKATLAEAFNLKHRLEELRVRELQTRLSRLEQQIGQRQSQRAQIIERRARELIEGDEIDWNSNADSIADAGNSKSAPDVGSVRKNATDEIKTPRSNGVVAHVYDPEDLPKSDQNPSATIDSIFSGDVHTDFSVPVTLARPLYRNLALSLEAARDEVEAATEDFARVDRLHKQGIMAEKVFREAKRRLETAQRKYRILQGSLAPVMSDLEMELKIAKLELYRDTELFQITNSRYETGQSGTDKKEVAEAELRMNRAQLAVERLKARYELYKKVYDQHSKPHVEEKEPVNSFNSNMAEEPPPSGDSPMSVLGMKLVPLPKLERQSKLGIASRYSGGMTVVEVDPEGPAFEGGIRQGDILVGLAKWETHSAANMDWILNRVDSENFLVDGKKQIRFIVIRNKEEKDGVLRYIKYPIVAPNPLNLDIKK